MSLRRVVLSAFLTLLSAQPVLAIDGQILISQAKALAGNVTPGDAPGFPVTLTRTGSYKLIGNLDLPAADGVNGIEANNVEITIDLNGFRIDGKSSVTNRYCIVGNQRNLTVSNGTVMRCLIGLWFRGGNIATDLRVAENNTGIQVTNTSAVIRNCTLIANRFLGILCTGTGGCLIENNLIRGVGTGEGARIGTRSTLIGNMITDHQMGVNSVTFPSEADQPALGDNNISGNVQATQGSYRTLHPNSCGTGVC